MHLPTHTHIAEVSLKSILKRTTHGGATSGGDNGQNFKSISVVGHCTIATKMNLLFWHCCQLHNLATGLNDPI